ncbi:MULTISPECIES: DUF4398 domain-containing protein [Leptospirillum]|jgi:hypothetical protein|uniref:DUF4398 domain-containing protein n=3 Tax=Leptospirillum ferriphilum TaxID=178606 RepID=A0A059XUL7_9BACT|nr:MULTISPECIES: DUF4398 domain-containing protein [Leptospirillum]EAY56323.1 MAG: conserved protein of unknown function [Leptospirillum rubarum]EIJ76952.1 MAG: uncharacterized protein C75L2_00560027 [Leptospirillum sp. Group II 'C75']AFS53561.1 hypothetical protein LFML04_1336 [Leptospirillum ferriphilum ML-04]AIA30548.1 hypothetical protein Y981_06530 [Leptospirillum ferriphilum YSK]AKS23518.1 hypothetical protein ABH19_06775 [Leptospirillum sp. Group II 'CF-1']
MKLRHERRSSYQKYAAGVISLSVALLIMGGCASSGPRPDAEITRASTLIDQSERAGSRNYAAFDLVNAKKKLKEAKKMEKEGNFRKARYLAKEAGVDAELATAKTQTAKAKEAEEQLKKSSQVLEKEINSGQ